MYSSASIHHTNHNLLSTVYCKQQREALTKMKTIKIHKSENTTKCISKLQNQQSKNETCSQAYKKEHSLSSEHYQNISNKNYLSLLLFRRVTYYKGILFGRTSTPPRHIQQCKFSRARQACGSLLRRTQRLIQVPLQSSRAAWIE